jgi:uncharacterized damage-inducible protein DinB
MTTEHIVDGDERADLLDALAAHRGFLCQTVEGLTDEQARRRTTVSELCLGGLIKHVARAEGRWADFIVRGPQAIGPFTEAGLQAHAESFRMLEGETLSELLDRYDQVARHTNELVTSLPSLDLSHPLPEAPWYEPGRRWSARRAVLHIIGETAQHAGHADIIREALDGAKTMG